MRGSLITFVIVIISASIMVNLTRSILTIAGRGSRLDERRAAYEEVAAQHAQLERKLIEVQNPQYIEKVAREKLGLTQPGEQIVLLPQWVNEGLGSSSATTANSLDADEPPWRQWATLFF